MVYVAPEILVSYYAPDLVGTVCGFNSSCVNNDPNQNCDHH